MFWIAFIGVAAFSVIVLLTFGTILLDCSQEMYD